LSCGCVSGSRSIELWLGKRGSRFAGLQPTAVLVGFVVLEGASLSPCNIVRTLRPFNSGREQTLHPPIIIVAKTPVLCPSRYLLRQALPKRAM